MTLSLFRLHARSIWYILTGREGGLSLWSRENADGMSCPYDLSPKKTRSYIATEFPDQSTARKELDEGSAVGGSSAPSESDDDILPEDDGPWYMGKAREEFNRRMRDAAAPGDDEDPVQVRRQPLRFRFSDLN